MSIERQKDVVYLHTTQHKKNELVSLAATWMDIEIITLSEVRERQIPYDITYMWNLKYDTNEHIYKTGTDSDIESKFMVTKGERQRRRYKSGVWD